MFTMKRLLAALVLLAFSAFAGACQHPTFNPNAPSNPSGDPSITLLYTFPIIPFPANVATNDAFAQGSGWPASLDAPGTISGQASITPDSSDDVLYIFTSQSDELACSKNKSACANYIWSSNANPRQFSLHVSTAKVYMVFWNASSVSVSFSKDSTISYRLDQ